MSSRNDEKKLVPIHTTTRDEPLLINIRQYYVRNPIQKIYYQLEQDIKEFEKTDVNPRQDLALGLSFFSGIWFNAGKQTAAIIGSEDVLRDVGLIPADKHKITDADKKQILECLRYADVQTAPKDSDGRRQLPECPDWQRHWQQMMTGAANSVVMQILSSPDPVPADQRDSNPFRIRHIGYSPDDIVKIHYVIVQ